MGEKVTQQTLVDSSAPMGGYFIYLVDTTEVLEDDRGKRTRVDDLIGFIQSSNLAYDNTTSGLAALNIQAAIDEVAGGVGGTTALSTSYDNSTSGMTAEDTQAAIDEIDARLDVGIHSHANKAILDAITSLGSSQIITAAERSGLHSHANAAVLDALTNAGSTQVITAAERLKLANIQDNATVDQHASNVPVTPSGNLSSEDVQAALLELQNNIDTLQLGGISLSTTAPPAPTGQTGTPGTSNEAAHGDHTHPAPAASIVLVSSAVNGNTNLEAIVDDLDARLVSTAADATANTAKLAGIEDNAKDDQSAGDVPVSPTVNGQANVQTALESHNALIASNASAIIASAATIPGVATAVPLVASGTGSIGASGKYATETHVHPVQTALSTPVTPSGNFSSVNVQDGFYELQENINGLALGNALSSTNVAGLANIAPVDGQVVRLLGYDSVADGGGQQLVYRSTGRPAITHEGPFLFTGPGVADWYEALNQDVANVRMAGAVGDGVTDDTAAIQAAIDSGAGEIYIPNGRYKITGVDATGGVRVHGPGVLVVSASDYGINIDLSWGPAVSCTISDQQLDTGVFPQDTTPSNSCIARPIAGRRTQIHCKQSI